MSARQHFSTPPGFSLPDLGGVADGVVAETAEPGGFESTYYDTPDLRLSRAGVRLVRRSDEGWIVTLRRDTGGAAYPQDEHRFDGEGIDPPEEAVDLVRAVVRTGTVDAVARLRTRRRRVELQDEWSKPLCELLDDEVTVLDGWRITGRFRELEVELDDAAPPGLADTLAGRLRAAGAGPPDPTPTVVRALGWRALEPPDVAPPARAGPSLTVGEVVRGALSASVGRLIAHDPGVRLGNDPEDVHQARVATRRLRSDLRTFRDVLDGEWAQSLRHDLRRLGNDLGEVRDTEVLLDRLRARIDRLPAVDQGVAEPIINRLLQRWDTGRRALLDELRAPSYAELLDRLVEAARDPRLVADVTDDRAAEVLPPLVRVPWDQLRAGVDDLPANPPDEALHELRKLAKHCRYSAEAVAPAVGKPARAFARAMADLQDVLGAHQDATVAESWLRDVASKASGREVFVAGQLAGLEHLDVERTRAAWRDVWRMARKKRLRQWL